MKLRIFGIEVKLPQKTMTLKGFRRSRNSGRNVSVASSYMHKNQDQWSEAPNPQVYLLTKQRISEVETQKAIVTSLSRHERWRVGGPL